MFDDVPEELNRRVREMPAEYRTAKLAAAAYEIILYYTSFQIREYMFSSFPLTYKLQVEGEHRLLTLGESIFSLRNEAVLPEISRRLRERDVRPTFYEAVAASFCKNIGYSVVPSPGLAKRGSDFDFSIVQAYQKGPIFYLDPGFPNPKINVEVTELRGKTLDVKRLVGSLNAKRSQLDKNFPSVIVCYHPTSWNDQVENLFDALGEAADVFLRQTGRVNWVVFIEEYVGAIPGHSFQGFVQHFICCPSTKPRIESARLNSAISSFFRRGRDQHGRIDFRPSLESWVNSILP